MSSKSKWIWEFIIDETLLKVGPQYIRLWVTINAKSKETLALYVSKERNMLMAEERFIAGLVRAHGKHPVSTKVEHGIHKLAGS